MMKATIFNIQRYSLHDGGGIRTNVFFKGCPFTCPWCCNPESLSVKPQILFKESLCMNCSRKEDGTCPTHPDDCPTGAKEIIGEEKSVEEVFDIVYRDYAFYESSNGGVTLSGGEFLLQADFAIELLKKCKEHNIHTAVETTMAVHVPRLKELCEVVDLFLVDFKIFDKTKSKEILHLNIEKLMENIALIQQYHGRIIPRIPLIPNYTATDENMHLVMEYLNSVGLKEVHLLPFHQLGEAKYKSIDKEYTCHELKPLTDAQIEEIQTLFEKNGFKTLIHG